MRWPSCLTLVGSDVLRDAAALLRRDVGMADGVEQRGLAVIDVPQDGYDRRTRLEIFRILVGDDALPRRQFSLCFLLFLQPGVGQFGFVVELGGDDSRRVEVDLLVDTRPRDHRCSFSVFDPNWMGAWTLEGGSGPNFPGTG